MRSPGPARATVTSVSAVFSEVFALAVRGGRSGRRGSSVDLVAPLSAPILLIAMLVPHWLPGRIFCEAVHDTAVRTNSHGIVGRAPHDAEPGTGRMLWLRWKTFSGSYRCFSAASRTSLSGR